MNLETTLPGSDDVIIDNEDLSVSYFPTGQWSILYDESRYYNGSLHLSRLASASISLSFFGRYIGYYSDLNYDHGEYTVSIDGDILVRNTSYSRTILPVQMLYEKDLDSGPHTIVVANADPGRSITLDYFVYRPSDNQQFELPGHRDAIIDGNDVRVTYDPPEEWSAPDARPAEYKTYSTTSSHGASVTIHFAGERIWYYSAMGKTYGAFQVSIDGAQAATFSAFNLAEEQVQVLYTSSVSPGQHKMTITNGQDGKTGLAYFVYRPVSTNDSTDQPLSSLVPEGTTSSVLSTSRTPAPASAAVIQRFPAGEIASIAIGVVCIVGMAVSLWFLFQKRRRVDTYRADLRPYPVIPAATPSREEEGNKHDIKDKKAYQRESS